MISKELLSEVLGFDPVVVEYEGSMVICYEYSAKGKPVNGHEINIHELAHKCKEWALKVYNISLQSNFYLDVSFCGFNGNSKRFEAESEPEAIFKACQLILDNSK